MQCHTCHSQWRCMPRMPASTTVTNHNRTVRSMAQGHGTPTGLLRIPARVVGPAGASEGARYPGSGSALIERRHLLLATAPLLIQAWLPRPSAAEITKDEVERAITGASSVIPALTTTQYVDKIRSTRGRAFQDIRALVDRGQFKVVSDNLSIDSFDAIYQSAFFLPWALLKQGAVEPAQQAYDAYLGLVSDIKAFDKLCIAASRMQADEEEVLAGLDRVEGSLDKLLATVPRA